MHASPLPRFTLLTRSQLGQDSCHSLLISLLRGLAALQVAAAHLRNEMLPSMRLMEEPALWYQVLAFFTGFAHQAVVVFFLISGWLVGGSLLNRIAQPRALAHYAIDRISRLWTVMIPVFILIVALGIVTGTLNPRAVDFSASNAYSWAALAGNLAGLQTLAVPEFGDNYALWSLANESWYYLMFPLLLLYMDGRHRLLAVGVMMFAAALLPFATLLYFIIWLLGAAFSRIRLDCGPTCRIALLLLLLGLSVYFRFAGSNDDLTIASFGQDLLLSLVFLPLLSSTIIPLRRHRAFSMLGTTAQVLSRFSFTLYVVHVPVIGMLHWLRLHLWGQTRLVGDSVADLGAYLAMMAIVVGFSYGFYWLFEARTGQVRGIMKRLLMRPVQPALRAM
jgi:peptidoglycan/LPS O-acetylase OafA/YrhL